MPPFCVSVWPSVLTSPVAVTVPELCRSEVPSVSAFPLSASVPPPASVSSRPATSSPIVPEIARFAIALVSVRFPVIVTGPANVTAVPLGIAKSLFTITEFASERGPPVPSMVPPLIVSAPAPSPALMPIASVPELSVTPPVNDPLAPVSTSAPVPFLIIFPAR